MGDKKVSNIKRMGVKSIHYNKNNIIIEDSFSKNGQIIYEAEFDDINNLKKLKNLKRNPNVKNNVSFNSVDEEVGFELSKKVGNEGLSSKVKSLKSKSYIQQLLNITDENNIEIQIYQNYEDLRKLVTTVSGHVLYSINSISSLDFEDSSNSKFDKIGTVSVRTEFEKYKSRKSNDADLKILIESMKKVFKKFGIGLKSSNKKDNRAGFLDYEAEKKDNILIYDYLRMFSAIRNFSVHGSLNEDAYSCFDSLSKIAAKDLFGFGKRFAKNNIKYKNILTEVYRDKNIFYEFFDYSVYAKTKNLGISIEKICKGVIEQIGENDKVSPANRAEYLNKFKNVLKFVIYKGLKSSNVEDIIQRLKETKDKVEKERVYKNLSIQFVKTEQSLIQSVQRAVMRYLGKAQKEVIEFDIDLKMQEILNTCENGFFNMLYVFSKLLTQKEANIFLSKLANKVENIGSLIRLAKKIGVKINLDHFELYKNVLPIDSDFEKLQIQLEILKNLRLNKEKEQKDVQKESPDYRKVLNSFADVSYTYDKLNEELNISDQFRRNEKPLKQFLRSSIMNSKSYQYITSVTDTRICPKIMAQREIVSFVIDSMLGIENKRKEMRGEIIVSKDKEAMLKYLSVAWFDYLGRVNCNKNMTTADLADLKGVVSGLTFEKISKAVFKKADHNYLALVKVYFNVCYLVVKNLMSQNTSYLIAFEDLEKYNKIILNNKNNCAVVDNYVINASNKNSRSYKQLQVLLGKEYIKDYYKKQEFINLFNTYRNCVTHCFLLNDLELLSEGITNVTSYFALYQILMQNWLKTKEKNKIDYVWGKNFETFFKLDEDKSYSTKFTIALNLPFAYNMARFNNLTIEKYFTKSRG